jgi:hypothetical protein
VYLVEVAPDLLALSYLSATLPDRDCCAMEIRLEGVSVAKAPAPAENGTVLLRTLANWGALAVDDPQVMMTENIQ